MERIYEETAIMENKERVLKYVNGLLYYYGLIDTKTLLGLVRQSLQLDICEKDFKGIIEKSFNEKGVTPFFDYDSHFFINTAVENFSTLLKKQAGRKELSFRPVSEKEALAAYGLLKKTNRDRYAKRIYQLLINKGWPKQKITDWVYTTENDFNNGKEQKELLNNYFREIEFVSEKELNDFAEALEKFLNNTPLWELKGWTPNEFAKNHEKPVREKRAEILNQQLTLTSATPKKTGRNDPCTCGSGKKYKRCCGENRYPEYELQNPNDNNLAEIKSDKVPIDRAGQSPDSEKVNPDLPTLQEWEELHHAALTFKEAKCWEWMFEKDIFAVENPETGELAYCIIMGQLGEVFALNAYLGAEGIDSFFRFQEVSSSENFANSENVTNAYFKQKCLSCSFENRENLDKEDLEIIKKLELKIRGKKQWPQFRSYKPGYYPWVLNAGECRFLTTILKQAFDVGITCRKEKTILSSKNPELILVRTRKESGKGPIWTNSYREIETYEHYYKTYNISDELYLRKTLNSAKKKNAIWEADTSLVVTPIQENKSQRPYLPTMFLLADLRTEMIIQYEMLTDLENESYRIINKLLDTINSFKEVPESIVVANEETFYYLEKACDQLGIELAYVKELELIPYIKKELGKNMGY